MQSFGFILISYSDVRLAWQMNLNPLQVRKELFFDLNERRKGL